jgi:hypothetical protein
VGRYGLQVRNPDPFFWRWLPPLLECGPVLLRQLSVFSLLGLVGLVLLVSRRAPRVPRRHLLVLLVACAVFFVAPFVEERFPSRVLRSIQLVSQHHFWFYLRLLESVLIGLAVSVLGRRLFLSLPRRRWSRSRWLGAALASGLVLAGLGLVHHSYRSRLGFAMGRAARLDFSRDERSRDRTEVVAWLRRATVPSEVFLASDSVSLMVVGPAGRRTLALEPNFASQYVDVIPRYRARGALLLALASGNHEAAARVASKWGVRYLVLWNTEPFERGAAAGAGLEVAFESRSYRVLRLP